MKRIYWKILNILLTPILRLIGNKGMLPHRKDKRDLISDFGSVFSYKTKFNYLEYYSYTFRQVNNICVFASAVLAVSEQLGIKFSVQFAVKLGKKLGMISGNGYSYQRAVLEMFTKYGLVPHEYMPSEDIGDWRKFSEWTQEAQDLLDNIAPNFKFTKYRKLRNEDAILEALDNDYRPITANGWWSGMSSPKSPLFLLKAIGRYIGGHAFRLVGYRKRAGDYDEITKQTFGDNYGDNGKAYLESSFAKGYFENYIFEYNGGPMLPIEKLLPTFIKQNEGKMVKCNEDSACYVIEGGVKKWVSGADDMKTFWHLKETKGLTIVKKQLLEALPRGEDYPLIK